MSDDVVQTVELMQFEAANRRHVLAQAAVKAADAVERQTRAEWTEARRHAMLSWPCPVCDAHGSERCQGVSHETRWTFVEEHRALSVECSWCDAAVGEECSVISGDAVHKHREMLSGVLGAGEQQRALDYIERRSKART